MLLAGMFLAWGWVLHQLVLGRAILPERPMVVRRPAPWRVGTVLLVFFVYVFVSVAVPIAYMLASGRVLAMSRAAAAQGARTGKLAEEPAKAGSAGPAEPKAAPNAGRRVADGQPTKANAPAKTAEPVKQPRPAAERQADSDSESSTSLVEMLAVFALTDVVLLLVIPGIVWLTSGATSRDFGISHDGWLKQAAVGFVAALVASPAVYALQILAAKFWTPTEHPVQKMLEKEFSLGVADLAFLSAVVVAPMFEELLFRGILQNWLVSLFGRFAGRKRAKSRELVADLACTDPVDGAEPMAALETWDSDPDYWEADDRDGSPGEETSTGSGEGDAPVSGEASGRADLAGGPLLRSGWLAIVVTSLLFGAVHAPQWPSPIPLFVLALVIGAVYQRTGSLVAAVFIHATFNGLSTLAMFAALLAAEIAPKKTDIPPIVPAPVGSYSAADRAWMHLWPDGSTKAANSSEKFIDSERSR
jgi:membrane protease YdiL (CAAX protease family)